LNVFLPVTHGYETGITEIVFGNRVLRKIYVLKVGECKRRMKETAQ
jgi:hypothetical protein